MTRSSKQKPAKAPAAKLAIFQLCHTECSTWRRLRMLYFISLVPVMFAWQRKVAAVFRNHGSHERRKSGKKYFFEFWGYFAVSVLLRREVMCR
jgi:hypothetical protein